MSVNRQRPLLSRRSLIAGSAGLALGGTLSNQARADEADLLLPDAAGQLGDMAPTPAPALTFGTPAGKRLSLAAFRGHVLLVNLWATWCPPCVAELPTFAALAPRMAAFGGLVLPVSIDVGGTPVVRAFYARHKITDLPVLTDPSGKDLDILDTNAVPVTLLITPQGLLAGRVEGAANWDTPGVLAILKKLAGGDSAAPREKQII